MQIISNTKEEFEICQNSKTRTRENSQKINYLNKINDKPWGKEYLAYQNNYIGIWILHVNKDQETSLHCHFKKDTILIPLSGCFKINLFNNFIILNLFESIYVPKNTFHGIHSYSDNAVLMEIEIYTEHVNFTDKNDLLRIKDIYNRDKNYYETSVVEREPTDNEIMLFTNNNKYCLSDSEISILTLNNFQNLKEQSNINIVLNGCLYSDGKRITPGSFIDLSKQHSFLTDNVELLSLYNVNYKNYSKIIYSKSHLIDFLTLHKLSNIGLTCGCFDIIHDGHIKNLKTCKNNCDNLFVCLSSDEQIKRLKGSSRPINNLNDRINMLINFNFIDYVILYEEIDDKLEIELDNIINIINPNIWFKGSDYTKDDILLKHPSLKNIILINLIKGKSTTNIIKKILS